MPPALVRAAVVLAAVSLLAACSRKREPALPAVPVIATPGDDAARRDSITAAEAARRDSIARAEAAERERHLAAARATLAAPVHFAFDRADLSPDARLLLDAKVPILRASLELRLRLAGHTDERGSDQYNLALGQRRAASAKQYLVWQGIDASRLDVVSFGEEQPVCDASDESCWSRNRRVEFEITAGDVVRTSSTPSRAN